MISNKFSKQVLAFCLVGVQSLGSFDSQVSAATQIVDKPGLISVCVNPSKSNFRAAQDDRCLGDPPVKSSRGLAGTGSKSTGSSSTGKSPKDKSTTSNTVKTSVGAACTNPAGNSARAAQDDRLAPHEPNC